MVEIVKKKYKVQLYFKYSTCEYVKSFGSLSFQGLFDYMEENKLSPENVRDNLVKLEYIYSSGLLSKEDTSLIKVFNRQTLILVFLVSFMIGLIFYLLVIF